MRRVLPPQQIAPGRWLLPRLPPSDPAALHRLATDCRELQIVLGRVGHDAQWVLADLRRGWTGPAASSAPAPLAHLARDLTTVRRALQQLADELDRLATALDRAAEQHDWSWRKAAAVGAVVAVTAGAVVVSVASAGTAAPGAAAAETAAVSVAAGELAAASSAAMTAEAAAAESLLSVARLARTVQALRAIVVPRVALAALQAPVWVETPLGAAAVGAGTTAGLERLEDGRVAWGDVGLAAVLGAGEVAVLSPGRSRGYVELTDQRLARLEVRSTRAALLRRNRAAFSQDHRAHSFEQRQVQTHYKHSDVFGLPLNYSRANARAFETSMSEFVMRPETVRIVGEWHGAPAIIYADYDTHVAVVCRMDGGFWTAMTLGPEQKWHLWHSGQLGGR